MDTTAPKLTDLVLATRTISEQGGACPFQAEGTILGQHFYFRFRNDYASLTVNRQRPPSLAGRRRIGQAPALRL
ncbi:hypothetical protein J7I84_20520 [Arthrobacter sp. ISL-85]|uniref:hypothetical protein n=1 Tax=Arthrobacter sp. ISL-85 TaxID=2819115 RepID=UPI001BEC0B2E|nr:hypothetical protein [Arthrobacter sp. ISL-85]MBT2568830.1 hypothetical protein [Arthrobacter sp. ISL-85]